VGSAADPHALTRRDDDSGGPSTTTIRRPVPDVYDRWRPFYDTNALARLLRDTDGVGAMAIRRTGLVTAGSGIRGTTGRRSLPSGRRTIRAGFADNGSAFGAEVVRRRTAASPMIDLSDSRFKISGSLYRLRP